MIITLDGLNLPQPKLPFKIETQEFARDNSTLDGTLHTNFTSRRRIWSMEWEQMSQADYDAIKAKYDAQFTTNTYPVLVIPFYSISSQARMTINAQDVIHDGACVRKIKIKFTEKNSI